MKGLSFLFSVLFASSALANHDVHPLLEKIGKNTNGDAKMECCVAGARPAGVRLAQHFQSVGADCIAFE